MLDENVADDSTSTDNHSIEGIIAEIRSCTSKKTIGGHRDEERLKVLFDSLQNEIARIKSELDLYRSASEKIMACDTSKMSTGYLDELACIDEYYKNIYAVLAVNDYKSEIGKINKDTCTK